METFTSRSSKRKHETLSSPDSDLSKSPVSAKRRCDATRADGFWGVPVRLKSDDYRHHCQSPGHVRRTLAGASQVATSAIFGCQDQTHDSTQLSSPRCLFLPLLPSASWERGLEAATYYQLWPKYAASSLACSYQDDVPAAICSPFQGQPPRLYLNTLSEIFETPRSPESYTSLLDNDRLQATTSQDLLDLSRPVSETYHSNWQCPVTPPEDRQLSEVAGRQPDTPVIVPLSPQSIWNTPNSLLEAVEDAYRILQKEAQEDGEDLSDFSDHGVANDEDDIVELLAPLSLGSAATEKTPGDEDEDEDTEALAVNGMELDTIAECDEYDELTLELVRELEEAFERPESAEYGHVEGSLAEW